MADAKQLAEALAEVVAAFPWDDMNAEQASAINQARQALAAFEAQAATAAEPKQEPAPVQFACWCADNGLQIFDTHDEAMEYANETLREYRKAASFDGECSGDVDSMWVGSSTSRISLRPPKPTKKAALTTF